MSPHGKHIFICTPVAFHGNDFFFIRDTVLICMNLCRLRVESKAIMPLPFHEDDIHKDIIRMPVKQLKSTDIYGKMADDLRAWHATLPPETQAKVNLAGLVPNHMLLDVYNSAKVLLCPSLYESSHIVSGEALCCGASVVSACQPILLRDVVWYTTGNSGTVAKEDTPESLADAMLEELQQWEQGHRDPTAIAAYWQPFFHADKVMARIFAPMAE